MSHIFISYSRKDLDFAQRIVDALAANNLDTWIDWKSIPKGEDWEQEIYRGIEEADAFLFLISPDSVTSQMCKKEIAHAAKNGKRILPIVIRDTDPTIIHPEISKRNWIFCHDGQDDFEKAIEETRRTIHTDYEWLKYHTELQVKALKWERKKDTSRLLRGKELREAEEQLAGAGSQKDPQPTELHRNYVLTSQRNEVRQRRQVTIGLGIGLAIVAVLAFFAWVQRNTAVTEANSRATAESNAITEANAKATALANEESARATAQAEKERAEQQAQISLSRQLAAQAIAHFENNYDLALLLAVQGSKINDNGEVQSNLVYVLKSKPQLFTYLHAQPVPDSQVPANLIYIGAVPEPNLDVGFSPDGKFLISSDLKQNLNFWDASTGQLLEKPPLSQMDAANLLWNTQAKAILHKLKATPGGTLALSPDSRLLAKSTSNGEIVLWDVRKGAQVGTLLDDKRYSHTALAFSPNGRLLASGGSNKTVRLWDLETLLPVGELMVDHSGWTTDWITDLAFHPDGSQLFSSGCARESTRGVCPLGEILVWDVGTQQLVMRLTGHATSINKIALDPEGRKLASAGSDSTIILWDLTQQSFLHGMFEERSAANALTFSPDGQTLISAGIDGTLGLWNVLGSKMNRTLTVLEDGNVTSVAFSPDGLLLASGDTNGNVRLWDGVSYATLGELRGKDVSSVESVQFSPDGTLLASGHDRGQILLWNVQTQELVGELLSESGDRLDIVKNLAFSPDGELLVSASIGEGFMAPVGARGHVFIWEVQTRKKVGEVRDLEKGSAYSLAFSPDGKYFVLGFLDGRLQLVDATAFRVFREWQAHVVTSSALAFNRDGTLLASSGLDQTVSLWDTRSWELIASLGGHTGELRAVAFSPDGKLIASAGSDPLVRLWEVGLARWQELACQQAGRNLTHAEWNRYVGENVPYKATCPNLPIPTE